MTPLVRNKLCMSDNISHFNTQGAKSIKVNIIFINTFYKKKRV